MACNRGLKQCANQLAMQYLDVIQAAQSGYSENPRKSEEEIIHQAITSVLTSGSISQRHCP